MTLAVLFPPHLGVPIGRCLKYIHVTLAGKSVFSRIQVTECISNFQYTDIIQYNTMLVFTTDNTYYYN